MDTFKIFRIPQYSEEDAQKAIEDGTVFHESYANVERALANISADRFEIVAVTTVNLGFNGGLQFIVITKVKR